MSDTYSVFVDGERVLAGASRQVALEHAGGGVVAREVEDGPETPVRQASGHYLVGPSGADGSAVKPSRAPRARKAKNGPGAKS